jgi:TetR/AcrR family fatty acid metabolism transcriptional regulator
VARASGGLSQGPSAGARAASRDKLGITLGSKKNWAYSQDMAARGHYKKSEASRRQVVDAAIQALARRGFAHTSVNDIADEAGMSKGAVHYHFTRKADLIAQVLERCLEVTHDRLRAVWDAPGLPTEKVRRALREMRERWRDGGPELRVVADLMAQGVHDEKLREPVAAMFQKTRAELVQHLIASVTAMGFKPRIPAHIVPRLLLATLDGLALHDFFDPPSAEDHEQIMRAIEVIAFSLFEI